MSAHLPRIRLNAGFSLPELSVVMFLTLIIMGVLLTFYSQSRLMLERGVSKTELEQRARYTAIRIIPKLTSVVRRPATSAPGDPYPDGIHPIILPPPSTNPNSDPGSNQIVLNTTKIFVKEQLREPILPADEFNPRGTPAAQFDQLRLWFKVTGVNPIDARLGNVGEVWMDRNTPANTGDDILVSKGLNFVSWMVYPDNRRIRLRIIAKGLIKNATSGTSVDTTVYETDVFLPVYTNAEGSTEN